MLIGKSGTPMGVRGQEIRTKKKRNIAHYTQRKNKMGSKSTVNSKNQRTAGGKSSQAERGVEAESPTWVGK